MQANFNCGLSLRNALVIGFVAGAGAIAGGHPAQAEVQADRSVGQPVALEAGALEAVALEVKSLEVEALDVEGLEVEVLNGANLEVEVPEELEDLREIGQQIGDRLGAIDPEVLKQVMRPLGRQALRIFLDSAPGLSQKAIELGEQGLAELEKRAMEGLEQAQEDFELDR